ncbi:uncharacterized protein LOC132301134 [Cornus florida]|uniref:uncharacterized protein LOC132301134 n=1 Tax=Cornus florida TaxID=4283 RepID=UPI002898580A|nr:uncharacterized protein LOC132301134 [Cornus florida]
MGSLGVEVAKKAMWLYPKVLGFNPSERWGHSACYSNGFVYVFGGCRGGLHFADVLVLNLDTMAWNTLVTNGQGPGPRDSHSAVIVGHRMIVFGGTNGSKKVNDLHILDLRSREWTQPNCKGVPPSPRESHTATLVGYEKLVIFGGSGEGEANYLNDLHVLDLKTMRWTSPEVKGDVPAPRDSHIAVAVGNKLFVYGGDCGDRYQDDVDMLDMDTLTWSRLAVQGSSPGFRAGHAAVNIGTKVYVIGGVGDKQYYNDVWVLDINTCSWTRLEICGQQPQGRFSHTAVITERDIVIYGGCGEDERPLNELVVLQLGAEHPKGCYNISLCKIFGKHCNQGKRRFSRVADDNSQLIFFCFVFETIKFMCDLWQRTMLVNGVERKEAHELDLKSKRCFQFSSDAMHPKRRRTSSSKTWEMESEPEEHSLSLSQHSSPSQSDQEQKTPVKKATRLVTTSQVFRLLQKNQTPSNFQSSNVVRRTSQDLHVLGEHLNLPKSEQNRHIFHTGRHEEHCPAPEQKYLEAGPFHNLIGAEIRGKVDGAFDSGYLMTATVDGKIFRGVLFAPGPEVVSRSAIVSQNPPSLTSHMAIAQPHHNMNHASPFGRHSQLPTLSKREPVQGLRQAQGNRPSPPIRGAPSLGRETKIKSDLQGVNLTLASPGSSHG